jgi:hypothetical protein
VAVNGKLVAQGSQFSVADVEVREGGKPKGTYTLDERERRGVFAIKSWRLGLTAGTQDAGCTQGTP